MGAGMVYMSYYNILHPSYPATGAGMVDRSYYNILHQPHPATGAGHQYL